MMTATIKGVLSIRKIGKPHHFTIHNPHLNEEAHFAYQCFQKTGIVVSLIRRLQICLFCGVEGDQALYGIEMYTGPLSKCYGFLTDKIHGQIPSAATPPNVGDVLRVA